MGERFSLSVAVADRIKKLWWDFSGDGIGEEFKFHLVSWSKVCYLILEGLRVYILLLFN